MVIVQALKIKLEKTNMLVQNAPVISQEIVTTGITPGKFDFDSYFQMGGEDTTNVSRVCGDFHDSFFKRSRTQCEMPQVVKFIEIPPNYSGKLEEAHAFKELRDIRVPIKLVGEMKELQRLGQSGHLAVCGISNTFLCRDRKSKLRLVKMKFVRTNFPIDPEDGIDPNRASWEICSSLFDPDEVLEGPMRIFIASR